jgi:protein ImuA
MFTAVSPEVTKNVLALSSKDIWRADQMGAHQARSAETGYEALDRELPDGGWPSAGLIELLPLHSGIGEMRLLQPALRRISPQRSIALVQPPHLPQAAAWAGWGLPMQQLLWIKTDRSADALWAAEQILRNGSCGALLFWQSHIRGESLRRLHLAAQSSDMLFWMMRPLSATREASPAPLRLCLRPAAGGLDIEILKRRGPPRDGSFFVPLAHMPASHTVSTHSHHARMDRRSSAAPVPRSHSSALV